MSKYLVLKTEDKKWKSTRKTGECEDCVIFMIEFIVNLMWMLYIHQMFNQIHVSVRFIEFSIAFYFHVNEPIFINDVPSCKRRWQPMTMPLIWIYLVKALHRFSFVFGVNNWNWTNTSSYLKCEQIFELCFCYCLTSRFIQEWIQFCCCCYCCCLFFVRTLL